MQDKDFSINNMGDMEIALLENNNSAVKAYLERVDRETSNGAFRNMAEFFKFPIVEIEGVVRASATDLARLLGYKNANGLTQLLDRWGISGIKVGGFTHDVQIEIQQTLELKQSDNKSTLLEYPAILVGGMYSQNEEAKPIKLYLFRCEYVARVGVMAIRENMNAPTNRFPAPAQALAMAKLASSAWKGNSIAGYILEKHFDVPVRQLMHRTDPEFSVLAGLITQYLHLIHEENIVRYGLEIVDTKAGFYVQGESLVLYQTFLDVSRRHNLRMFFDNQKTLGTILSREEDALGMLGFKRNIAKTVQGSRHYRYEYSGGKALALAKNN